MRPTTLERLAADMADAPSRCTSAASALERAARNVVQAAKLLGVEVGKVTREEKGRPMVAVIPVPKHLAARFPNPEANKGLEPHITVAFIAAEGVSPGKADEILGAIRAACRSVKPFRVQLDTNSGLHDFGLGTTGYKALWFQVRQDPGFAVNDLHHALKSKLKLEGLPFDHQHSFSPHCTWQYVTNDQPEEERQRMSNLAANRFNDMSTWFDVRSIELSMPDGSSRLIPLAQRR